MCGEKSKYKKVRKEEMGTIILARYEGIVKGVGDIRYLSL
jgi:hypothetical protein